MKKVSPIAALLLAGPMFFSGGTMAGSLSDGQWTAAHCGQEPEPPAIESGSAEAYNRSLKLVRDWQQQAQAFNNCVVREANADNEAIAKAANVQQARFKATVEGLNVKASEIKAKLDRR